MGMTGGAEACAGIVENTRHVIAIEAMAAAQALDFLGAAQDFEARGRQPVLRAIRSVCARPWTKTGSCTGTSRGLAELIASGKPAEALR